MAKYNINIGGDKEGESTTTITHGGDKYRVEVPSQLLKSGDVVVGDNQTVKMNFPDSDVPPTEPPKETGQATPPVTEPGAIEIDTMTGGRIGPGGNVDEPGKTVVIKNATGIRIGS